MGPAPMIRIVEISVLFGIKSHGRGNWAQKKGAQAARPSSQERVFLARGWSLDQISQSRKGLTGAINRQFDGSSCRTTACHSWLSFKLTGGSRAESLPRDKGHPPRIVADVEMRARGGKSSRCQLGDHLAFAIALQSDARTQLAIVRKRGAQQPDQGVFQKAIFAREAQQRHHISAHADLGT